MLFFPRSILMQSLNIVSVLKSCYNHILTLYFWGSVFQWSTIKTKYHNFTFFKHFYILTMVNHVVKDGQKPVSEFNHGIKDLKRHVRTISMVYHCILFLRMSDLPWETCYYHDCNNGQPSFRCTMVTFLTTSMEYKNMTMMGNHDQPWKHGFH